MSGQRRQNVWVATCGLLVVLAGPLAATSAASAPTAQGWWTTANQGVRPPSPPDVPSDGLLVQGVAARSAAPGVPASGGTAAAGTSTQAMAAVTFTVEPGAVVERLVLKVVGNLPSSMSVIGCLVTGPYEPAQNGEFAKRPSYDCAVTATPRLDPAAHTLVFGPDLATFVKGNQLALALIPGELDRLVFEKPARDALSVRIHHGTGAPGESAFTPGAAPAFARPLTGSEPGPSKGGFENVSVLGPTAGTPDSLVTPAVNLGGTASPVIAVGSAPPALGDVRTEPTRLAVQAVGTGQDRRPLLLLGLVVIVAAFFLSAHRDGAAETSGQPASTPSQVRGVGRFRQTRTSRSVPL